MPGYQFFIVLFFFVALCDDPIWKFQIKITVGNQKTGVVHVKVNMLEDYVNIIAIQILNHVYTLSEMAEIFS